MTAGALVILAACGVLAAHLSDAAAGRLVADRGRPLHPLERSAVHAAAVGVFALAGYVYGFTARLAAGLAVLAVLAAVTVTDLRANLIPNRLLLVGTMATAPLVLGTGLRGPGDALAGVVICGGLMYLVAVAARGGMGGGDVKFAAYIGMVLGWRYGLVALLVGVVAGGLAGAVLLATRRRRPGDGIPYGPFLAAGAATALLWGGPLVSWYLGR